MSDFTKRLRQIESENSECSILAGNCADAIEIEQKKVAIEIARLRAENEKLRDGVRSTIQERDVLSGENWDLRAENEKLCGLLREAWVKMESNNLWSNLRARVAAAIRETNDGNDHKNRPTDPVDNSQRVSLRTLPD